MVMIINDDDDDNNDENDINDALLPGRLAFRRVLSSSEIRHSCVVSVCMTMHFHQKRTMYLNDRLV